MREQGHRPDKLDINTLWADFDSENLISLFKDDPDMIELLSENFDSLRLEPVERADGSFEINP